jgi:predicted nuclease of restriction endonuclease-like (RecB) superfamily
MKENTGKLFPSRGGHYSKLLLGLQELLRRGRHRAAQTVNTVLAATYWEMGRRIVEFEQGGKVRAEYGDALLDRLARDLGRHFGSGFSRQNLSQMRQFYRAYPSDEIRQTLSGEFDPTRAAKVFPLAWSHYTRLLSLKTSEARAFYQTEALRGGWSVRQLERQIDSQFFERTALSRDKMAMVKRGARKQRGDHVSPEEEIKNPYVLEFLDLKDQYSESDLEEALIHRLEAFLMELGNDFTFVARQRRLRVGGEWYRVDLMFFHRKLRCLVLVDLKLGRFTHADAGQMHLYLNYAREHWTQPGENPPVGLILCALKDAAVAHYSLEGLPNKVLAAEYLTHLPNGKKLIRELERSRSSLEGNPGK